MFLDQVITLIFVRETSCYCTVCITGTKQCGTMTKVFTRKDTKQSNFTENDTGNESTEQMSLKLTLTLLPWMTLHNDEWYIGKVVLIADLDKKVEVTFMKKKRLNITPMA